MIYPKRAYWLKFIIKPFYIVRILLQLISRKLYISSKYNDDDFSSALIMFKKSIYITKCDEITVFRYQQINHRLLYITSDIFADTNYNRHSSLELLCIAEYCGLKFKNSKYVEHVRIIQIHT